MPLYKPCVIIERDILRFIEYKIRIGRYAQFLHEREIDQVFIYSLVRASG